jgi:hypothetical protein
MGSVGAAKTTFPNRTGIAPTLAAKKVLDLSAPGKFAFSVVICFGRLSVYQADPAKRALEMREDVSIIFKSAC